MLWTIIVWLYWIGVGLSFVATVCFSFFQFVIAERPVRQRAAYLVRMWGRWALALVGSALGMIVLGFVLYFVGVPMPAWYSDALRSNRATPNGTQCPEGYYIKANASSKIYLLRGDYGYETNEPTACYKTLESVERAGYTHVGRRR